MRVSFVIPTYNCAAWLPLAVKSVLEQTYKDVECVIVDDCSTDTTGFYLDWLEKQGDQRVRVIRNKENLGRSASRNIGNHEAAGEVICVLDADDMACPDRAKLTVGMIKKGASFVYGSARAIDALGALGPEMRCDVFNREKALKDLTNGIVHSTVGYTKAISLNHPYHTGVYSDLGIDDWHQQLRVSFAGEKMEPIQAVISHYRVLSTSISQTRKPSEVEKAKRDFIESLAVAK